jgi:4-hydroxy-3-polyprenylbenzoate decarboxylase
MGHRNLVECLDDLRRHGQLRDIDVEIDPHLEAGAIQRRVFEAGGPALLFRRVKGTPFPMAANLFGTLDRTRFLFRDTLEAVRHLVELKVEPPRLARQPWRYRDVPFAAMRLVPTRVRSGPIQKHTTTLDQLPKLVSWPNDGGPFVTLPLVYTEHPARPGWRQSNLGMYRVQLAGNEYASDEVGLHYQLHRGIGVHHAAAIERGEPLRVNIIVGGQPALSVAAVMPLPEGLPELSFAGALGGRRLRLTNLPGWPLPVPAEADFVISGTIDPSLTKPEGPFGDHLGYYALVHDFPVMKVERVSHRPGAIWPFTTVGRPPQEDTSFGAFIHELTGPLIPTVIPGVKAVHAVDAAGVHPLLLAVGSERYVPYAAERRPMELLTQANAILGQGQLSLAKYLLIAATEDDPTLDPHDIASMLRHVLERIDWANDLHFQTRTTMDTLDYSGDGFNRGSKVVIAAAGPKRRELGTTVPAGLNLPARYNAARVVQPGILAISGPTFGDEPDAAARLAALLAHREGLEGFPLVTLVDDAEFASRSLRNWLWVTFTRSNPAADIEGAGSFVDRKHWGCDGPLVIDARIKPHHAPPVLDDPDTERRVDALGAPGGPLHGII